MNVDFSMPKAPIRTISQVGKFLNLNDKTETDEKEIIVQSVKKRAAFFENCTYENSKILKDTSNKKSLNIIKNIHYLNNVRINVLNVSGDVNESNIDSDNIFNDTTLNTMDMYGTEFEKSSTSFYHSLNSVNNSNNLSRVSSSSSDTSMIREIRYEMRANTVSTDSKSLQLSITNNAGSSRSLSSTFTDYDELMPETDNQCIKTSEISDIQNYGENSSKKMVDNMTLLFNDPNLKIGNVKHIATCLDFTKSGLIQTSVAEKIQYKIEKSNDLAAFLEITNIQLGLKDGYVLINYHHLYETKHRKNLLKLKTLHHMVLFARSRWDENVKSSDVYTLINREEAIKLSLPHDRTSILQMYGSINFSNLQPQFKVAFELCCMEISSDQIENKEKSIQNFLKQILLGQKKNDKYLSFANMGSFTMTAYGLRTWHQPGLASTNVLSNCPMNGMVKYNTKLSLSLKEQCFGRLNISQEIDGIKKWSFFDCRLMTTAIFCWHSMENVDDQTAVPNLLIAFHNFVTDATICDDTVCVSQNIFTISLNSTASVGLVPINKDDCTNFFAEASSHQEAVNWVFHINRARQSFIQWTDSITI